MIVQPVLLLVAAVQTAAAVHAGWTGNWKMALFNALIAAANGVLSTMRG